MSTENESSAAVVNSPATQGANPVQKLETRGENDFAKQLEAQGGAEQAEMTQTATETAQPATTAPATQTQAAVTPPAAQPATTNAETIRSIVEATVAGMGKVNTQQTQATPERELTTAEFNAKYGIPTVDAAFMQRILDADPAKGAQALQSLIIQAVRSGALISKDLFSSDLQKFRGEVEPSMKYYQTEQIRKREEALRTEFYTLNPDLKGEEALVDELTAAMVARVNAGQLKISSKEEGFRMVADGAKKIVARMNKPITGGTQQGQGTAQAAAPATRQMSAASSAGRSGTGQPTKKSDVEEIFGADAR